MSLSFLGFLTIILVLAAILSGKVSPLVSMIVIPSLVIILSGRGGSLDSHVINGVRAVAPTAVMFIFAILFFNMMIVAGAFEPLINLALRFGGRDPVKISIATVFLACIAHLDGSGSTTFIITVSAMLPVYRRLRMNLMHLILLTSFGAGIMNIIPWGGPTLRVMTVFKAGVHEVFTPMLLPMAAGLGAVFLLAVHYGRQARKNILLTGHDDSYVEEETSAEDAIYRRPKLVAFNLAVIVVAVVTMLLGLLSPTSTMLFACVIAFIANYSERAIQDKLIQKFAPIILSLTSLTFAAGVFTGILNKSGMLEAMAESIAAMIPAETSGFLAIFIGFLGVPLSMLFSPDAYYYGIVPTVATAFAKLGMSPIAIGQLSLLGGQMTLGSTMTPLIASSFLLPSLVNIEFADYQKKAVPLAIGLGMLMVLVAVVTGCVKVF